MTLINKIHKKYHLIYILKFENILICMHLLTKALIIDYFIAQYNHIFTFNQRI